MVSNIIAFSILAGMLVLIPGLDFALVLRYATTQSRRSALEVMVGITSGLFVWGAFATLGISAILQASQTAFNALRIIGSIYMVWMGIGFIRNSMSNKNADITQDGRSGKGKAFTNGLFSNLLNPKAGVFYLSVLPQFIPEDSNHLLFGLALTGIHALITIVFFTALILFINALKDFFMRPRVIKNMERISGIAVICFGASLLLSNSH
ncbi:MAG: LysE family translocator [Candidatus Nanopelagicaceae bacterium]